ncbi:MAG: sialate O-acetylesterase [Thermoguttaceae bacterium]
MSAVATRRFLVFILVSAVALGVFGLPARADVKLPAILGDNMALQRDVQIPVWGWADAGEKVTVTLGDQSKTATADTAGKWMVRLDALKEGGPLSMTVRGKNSITVENILVGEVWVCSGQSNMGFAVRNANNAEEEIASANYPEVRLFSVPLVGTQEPQYDCNGKWVVCSPETVGTFTAVGYFFGRELHKNLKIPVGLINTSWGGSSCEAWVRHSILEADPAYARLLAEFEKQCAQYNPEAAKAKYEEQLAKWKAIAREARGDGKAAPAAPRAPQDPRSGQHRPANLYNGMILPILPYAIRGAVWYQGESNAGRAYQYRDLFPKMIRNWREDWGQGDFPFYFVQLANYMQVRDEPVDSAWAELREAQTMTMSLPKTGQAVIIDIGEAGDIHPKNKQDVGKRLALWALAKDYGRELVYSGPMYKSMKKDGSKIVLSFDHVGGGLVAKGGEPLKGFAIAGEDKAFVWADARIDGDTIVVSSPKVTEPVAVRYAWADNPICNLYNREELPASPFRTDQWPGVTAGK